MGSINTVTSSPPSYEVIVQESSNELPPPSYAEAVALLHRTIENGKYFLLYHSSLHDISIKHDKKKTSFLTRCQIELCDSILRQCHSR